MPHKKEEMPQLNKVKNFFQKRKCLKNTEMPQKKIKRINKIKFQKFFKNKNASKKGNA